MVKDIGKILAAFIFSHFAKACHPKEHSKRTPTKNFNSRKKPCMHSMNTRSNITPVVECNQGQYGRTALGCHIEIAHETLKGSQLFSFVSLFTSWTKLRSLKITFFPPFFSMILLKSSDFNGFDHISSHNGLNTYQIWYNFRIFSRFLGFFQFPDFFT